MRTVTFLGYGLTLNQVNLVGTKSLEAVYEIMKAYATENNDDWIIGRGWDQKRLGRKIISHKQRFRQHLPKQICRQSNALMDTPILVSKKRLGFSRNHFRVQGSGRRNPIGSKW